MKASEHDTGTALVGRAREHRLLLAALSTGRDVVLEGPPGTGKSTLLREITARFGVPLVFVEGNADLTSARIVGHHSPAQALRDGFSADTFVPGPLVQAMQSGGFLYIEEINRTPEDTLNALLTAIAEREIHIPRVGKVVALPGFRVVASMNPFDNIGTSRIGMSVHDRLCRIAVDYQSHAEEVTIVELRAVRTAPGSSTGMPDGVTEDAVALMRATRSHPEIRQGSSVRGAIDLALIAAYLLENNDDEQPYAEVIWDAMVVALSGRIQLDEISSANPEAVLRTIWEKHFADADRRLEPG